MMEMAEQTLMNELNKLLRKKFRSSSSVQQTGRQSDLHDIPPEIQQQTEQTAEKQFEYNFNNTEYQEKDVIRLLLNYGQSEIEFEEEDENKHIVKIAVNVANFIVDDLNADEIKFNNTIYQKIFEEYNTFISNEDLPDEKHFINHENKKISSAAIDLLTSPYELSDKWESVARIEVITEAKKLKLAVINAVLSFKAKKVEQLIEDNKIKIKEEQNDEDIMLLLKQQQELKLISKNINRQLGRVITR